MIYWTEQWCTLKIDLFFIVCTTNILCTYVLKVFHFSRESTGGIWPRKGHNLLICNCKWYATWQMVLEWWRTFFSLYSFRSVLLHKDFLKSWEISDIIRSDGYMWRKASVRSGCECKQLFPKLFCLLYMMHWSLTDLQHRCLMSGTHDKHIGQMSVSFFVFF